MFPFSMLQQEHVARRDRQERNRLSLTLGCMVFLAVVVGSGNSRVAHSTAAVTTILIVTTQKSQRFRVDLSVQGEFITLSELVL